MKGPYRVGTRQGQARDRAQWRVLFEALCLSRDEEGIKYLAWGGQGNLPQSSMLPHLVKDCSKATEKLKGLVKLGSIVFYFSWRNKQNVI